MRRPRRSWRFGAGALPALALASACSDGGEKVELTAAQRGKQIYENVCIACHAADPAQDGTVGPAVAGASVELLEARVIHGTYPPGYDAKRDGGAMPQFPFLKDNIGDLAAYLAEAAQD